MPCEPICCHTPAFLLCSTIHHDAAACAQPGIVGIAEVVREAYPDHTAADASSEKYDAKHTADKPKWFMVDVKLVRGLADYCFRLPKACLS